MSGKREETRQKVIDIIEPLLKNEGYELVEVELAGAGKTTVLRLFIDKEGGVTLDDCATVSQAVSAMLDVEDPIESAYELEVSSPGVDRPLRRPEDYTRFAGQKAKVKTFGPVPGAGDRKVFIGNLLGFEADHVRIDVDGTEFKVPQEAIAKAHLVWEPEVSKFAPKKKK